MCFKDGGCVEGFQMLADHYLRAWVCAPGEGTVYLQGEVGGLLPLRDLFGEGVC